MEIDYCLIGKITVVVLALVLYLVFSFGLIVFCVWTHGKFRNKCYPRRLVFEEILGKLDDFIEFYPILLWVVSICLLILAPVIVPLQLLELAIKVAITKTPPNPVLSP